MKMPTQKIKLDLDISMVNDLCAICDQSDLDVNIRSGSLIVSGESVLGVTQMCGRSVVLEPITQDPVEYYNFYKKVAPLGAYLE